MEKMKRFLAARAENSTLRTLSPIHRRRPGTVVSDEGEFSDFSSNDYLSLAQHPAVVSAAAQALQQHGVGAGASRLMSGDLHLHHQLEEEIARFKGYPAALLFSSGYQANCGLLSALVNRHDVIYADELCHASLIDGAMISRAKLVRFRHNDMQHLADLLARSRAQYQQALLISESLFSMDGDVAPLAELVTLKEQYHGELFIDEAHATGVFGAGLVAQQRLCAQVEYNMGTFSKALGGFGAYLACSELTREYLINSARNFIYTTALPAVIIAANLAALGICIEEPQLGKELLRRAADLRDALHQQGWQVSGTSQIIPIMLGENATALQLAEKLKSRKIRVLAIRPPTVPEGQARLRISLCSGHTNEQISALLEAMNDFC